MDRQTALALYRVMRTIRRFEQRATALFGEDKIWGTLHSYAGGEAVAAGVCATSATTTGSPRPIAGTGTASPSAPSWAGCSPSSSVARPATAAAAAAMHIADTSKGNLGAERAFENAGGTSGRDRLRMMNLIPELEAGEFGDYPAALAIHAEGSVEAEKSTVRRAYDPPPSRDYVRRIAGMDP